MTVLRCVNNRLRNADEWRSTLKRTAVARVHETSDDTSMRTKALGEVTLLASSNSNNTTTTTTTATNSAEVNNAVVATSTTQHHPARWEPSRRLIFRRRPAEAAVYLPTRAVDQVNNTANDSDEEELEDMLTLKRANPVWDSDEDEDDDEQVPCSVSPLKRQKSVSAEASFFASSSSPSLLFWDDKVERDEWSAVPASSSWDVAAAASRSIGAH